MFALLSEDGRIISQAISPGGTAVRFLPPYDAAYPCLRYIDPYDDTIFTGLQMEAFLPDWQEISQSAVTFEEKDFVNQVEALAERCKTPCPGPFLYLKYYGD